MMRGICLLAGFLVIVPDTRAASHFLSRGPGAAEEAMGEAVVATVSGPNSLYYNSAGLGSGPSAVTAEWTSLISGANYSWFGASADIKFAHLGLGLANLDLGNITTRSGPNDSGTTIASYQRAYMAGSSREILPGLLTGMTIGLLDFNLAGYRTTSLFSDWGLLYQVSERLNLGFASKNIYFSGLNFGGETEKYPREFRFGASWRIKGLNLTGEAGKTMDGSKPSVALGLGYTVFKLATFRAGFNSFPRFGLGLQTPNRKFILDLSYLMRPVSSTQRITLSYVFRADMEDAGPKDPFVELQERAKSLADYYSEESKRLLETRQHEAPAALKKVFALDPSNSDVAQTLSILTGVGFKAVRASRWPAFTPWEKRRRRLYLRFAINFADDSRIDACNTGREFHKRWPGDSRSPLIRQLLKEIECQKQ